MRLIRGSRLEDERLNSSLSLSLSHLFSECIMHSSPFRWVKVFMLFVYIRRVGCLVESIRW